MYPLTSEPPQNALHEAIFQNVGMGPLDPPDPGGFYPYIWTIKGQDLGMGISLAYT